MKYLGLKAYNSTYKELIEIVKSASKYMHSCKCSLDLQFPNDKAAETFTNPINFCPLCFLYLAAAAVVLAAWYVSYFSILSLFILCCIIEAFLWRGINPEVAVISNAVAKKWSSQKLLHTVERFTYLL